MVSPVRSRASIAVRIFAVFCALLGGGSLLLFAVFLYFGSLHFIDLGLDNSVNLTLDSLLCLAFFVQHSVMVRVGFRRRLRGFLGDELHGAAYTAVSGALLILLVVFWQSTLDNLVELGRPLRWLLRSLFVLGMAGFVWSARALGELDMLGLRAIDGEALEQAQHAPALVVGGPYRWVRHPFYFFSLVLIWSCPDLTADRLLFNVLFSGWIVVGTRLEERDLVATFGEPYREFQRHVPMLVPSRLRPTRWSPRG
jgi:protein-S-isoprenylcysteine O-methyltransferase Ste14